SPTLGTPEWRGRIAALATAPPFLVRRLWLDRAVEPGRPAFLAVGGRPPLDNVTVLDRYDQQARDWAAHSGGSVIELHAYAAVGPDAGERALARLHDLYPETKRAAVVADSALWRADCPLFGLGDFGRRPRVRTPFGGLVLAGDGIRIDLPVALMERAATTGWQAANCLLARWGLAGHELHTVPTRGRLALLRACAVRQDGSA
ncbi:MAG TPA: isorenieratene synthase, partial [Trebonia sp.]|nr:isorenieratene synthase [Trebonia sp.]